jgi:enoyl-CoA hydratase/carnithine racemase
MIPPAAPSPSESRLTIDGRVAVLAFDRDDVRNALTGTAVLDDLLAVLAWIENGADIGALILTGNGSAFSAGGNIKDMKTGSGMFAGAPMQLQQNYRRGIQRMALAIHACEIPVIAAVNGAAVGAGFDLACMCDIRIASDKAKFGETFINLGIIPGDGGAWFLQRVVGYQRACELAFSGRIIDAAEALRIGLVMETVGPSQLMTSALALAQKFAAQPAQALRQTKRLMKMAQRTELPDFLDHCAQVQAICHSTEEHQQALDAMLHSIARK